jgi:hypothetical protein
MIKLPLMNNTVCTVEQAVKDCCDDTISSPAFFSKYLNIWTPTFHERKELIEALDKYRREEQ